MTKLYRYTSIENTFGCWVFSAFVFALLMFAPGGFPVCADSGDSPIPAIQSGTSLYLQEQLQRLQAGKKISVDPNIVPADFWNPSSDNSPQNAYRWPTFYFGLDPDRNDTNGNSLRECRVKIDLSGFANSGVYSAGEVLRFETELRSVIALYNAALKNVGLEFLEVNNGSQHLTIEAIPFASGQEGVVSLATLFGAWSGDTSVFQIRSDYPNFNALLDLTNNGAPTALFRRPPGNPYAHVFSEDVFTRTDLQGNSIFAYPISNIFLRELGHLIGLMEPSTAYLNASAGALESYLIDWLAWPTIKGTPPKISGLNLGGENFSKSQWSGVFMNSFMNEDSLFYQIYSDLTPPVKAFIAHYYARYDYGGAQVLLDQAIQEHNTYSWLASGKAIQEVESNNNLDESFSVSIGKPVLGALSSFDPADVTMGETQQDVEDWYKIRFVTADQGRELVCTIGHATSIDRAVRLELYNSQGVLLAASGDEEYAEIRQTVQSTGVHYVAVKRPANPSLPGVRDYLLSIFFSDGQPPFGPTSTPTPTVMPTATPTPIAVPVLKGPLGESILGLGPVQSLAYSPDGLSIATAGGQGLILWSADTGAPTRRFGSHASDVLSVAFSLNGSMLASCSRDGVAKVWDLTSGAEIVTVTGHAGAINAVVFSRDNGKIITVGDDRTAKVWEIQTGNFVQTYTAHRAAVNAVAVSPDGKNVLTGSKDNSAKLWDLATGNTLRTFTGHLGAVQSVAFSPNGETILTGSLDTTAKLWSVQTGVERASFKTGSINSVAFSSDGVTVAIGSNAGAKLANLVSGTFTKTLIEGNTKVLAIGFSPNGTRIATAGSDNSVRVFDVVTGQVVQSLKGHTSIINTVAYSPDSQRIVSSGGDNVVRIWDKNSGAIVRSFETSHTGTIASVAFSPDGLTVLTGSEDGTAILWDAASGEAFRIFSGHTGGINAVAFTLDGNQILTAGNDRITRLWDIASGKSVRSFNSQQSAVKAVSVLPDGSGLMMGNTDGAVTEWNFDSTQPLQSFDGLGGALLSLAISSDGATIAGGYQDQIVRIWNRAARSLHSFYSAKGPVTAVAFSPIKPWVLVAGGNEIRLWHLSQTYLISVFDSHVDQINSLAFAPDGRSFASGSSDGTLRVWHVGGLVDATPTPTPTSTSTPTFTPTNTPTFTPTFTRTPTPTFTPTFTPTPTPVWVDVPVNTIYVTDDLQSTENLLGGTDLDSPTDKILAVRWNIPGENILDYHVYVRTNNGDPVYIGQTRNPNIQYFNWKEPQFGNFYSFVVFALVSGSPPIIVNTDKRVYYQTSESPTPTPTKVPVFFEVPANSIIVTDDIWSTENLVGAFDRDDASERFLTIRWNIQAEDIVDYHIYTRINDGDAVYLGRTGTPSITYFNWTEPQFNNRYRFIVFGLRKELPYAQITAAGEVFYQSVVNPTPTPTSTASPTPTPTKTPVPFTVPPNRIYVTDDLGTTENLIGLFDKDDPDDRALGIRWNVPDPAVTDFHVYVSVNGSTEFFLGRTGSGEVMQLDWRENGPGISKMFSQGPQFSNSYGFTVFGIRPDQTPTLIRSESVVLFEQEGSTLPTATPTPTVTPTPRMAPNSVIVADNVDDFLGLTSGEDYDIPSRRDLVVRWNFAYKDVTDYHIYVSVNSANAEYLGRTASGTIDYFEWKINSPRLNPKFWNGPEFGNTYQFYLYAVRSSGSPSHYGPFTHKGAIRFMEWIEAAPGN